jgi:hypothetical protein
MQSSSDMDKCLADLVLIKQRLMETIRFFRGLTDRAIILGHVNECLPIKHPLIFEVRPHRMEAKPYIDRL